MQQSIFVLNAVNSVANQIFLELRDKKAQLNRGNFKRNLVKLGQLMAYELSKSLQYETKEVETVLGTSSIDIISKSPVFFTIIRAGLPYLEGFLNIFEHSDRFACSSGKLLQIKLFSWYIDFLTNHLHSIGI